MSSIPSEEIYEAHYIDLPILGYQSDYLVKKENHAISVQFNAKNEKQSHSVQLSEEKCSI
jgi:hypothetical protein